MSVLEQVYSAEELWALSHLPQNAGKHFALSEGELLEMSPTGWEHGQVVFRLTLLLGNFVMQHSLGDCTGAETGYLLHRNPNGKDTVRAPDFAFVAAHRVPAERTPRYLPLAPDLAVEVVSPSDGAAEIDAAIEDFLKFGTRQVWVVYPKRQRLVVHTTHYSTRYTAEDTLDGGDLLPGFTLVVRNVFPGKQ